MGSGASFSPDYPRGNSNSSTEGQPGLGAVPKKGEKLRAFAKAAKAFRDKLYNRPFLGKIPAGAGLMEMGAEALSEGANAAAFVREGKIGQAIKKNSEHFGAGNAARIIAKEDRIAEREGHESRLAMGWIPRARLTIEGRMRRFQERIDKDYKLSEKMGVVQQFAETEDEGGLEASLSPAEQNAVQLVTVALARSVAADIAGPGNTALSWNRHKEFVDPILGHRGIRIKEQIRPTVTVKRNPDGTLRIQTETFDGNADNVRMGPNGLEIFRDADGNERNVKPGTVARAKLTTFECGADGKLYVIQRGPDGKIEKTSLDPREEIDSQRFSKGTHQLLSHPRADQRTIAALQGEMKSRSTLVTAVRLSPLDFGKPRTGIFVEHGESRLPAKPEDVLSYIRTNRLTADNLNLANLPGNFVVDALPGQEGKFSSATTRQDMEEAGLNIVGYDEVNQDRAEGEMTTTKRKKLSPEAYKAWEGLTEDQKTIFRTQWGEVVTTKGIEVAVDVTPGKPTSSEEGESDRTEIEDVQRELKALERRIVTSHGLLSTKDAAAFEDYLDDPAVTVLQLDSSVEGGLLGADDLFGEVYTEVTAARTARSSEKAIDVARQLIRDRFSVAPDDEARQEIVDRLVSQILNEKTGQTAVDVLGEKVSKLSRRVDETLPEYEARIRKQLSESLDVADEAQKIILEGTVKQMMESVELTDADVDYIAVKARREVAGLPDRDAALAFMYSNVTNARAREIWLSEINVKHPSLETQATSFQSFVGTMRGLGLEPSRSQ